MSTGETVTLSQGGTVGTPAAETVIPRHIGPVRLLREIGRGGMGVVWLGRHQVLARDVAVKFLLQAASDSGGPGFQDLLAEARAAASVRHAGLITVYDAAVVSGVPYLVMDCVDGVALADVLRAVGPLSSAAALAVLDAVGDAVAALHDAGLVHRDLKPRNILLDRAGRPYVGDFGLACACPPAKRTQLLTAGGTPPYMAPEMFTGEASPRSDVYALGVMLYELLTGVQPFRGNTFEEVRAKHQTEALPLEPLVQHQVAPAVIEVLERATHKTALYRTKTARHFVQALHATEPDKEVWSRGAREWEQLVGRCDRGAEKQMPAESDTPPPTTYAELIATKAAWKRERKAFSPNTPAAAPIAAGSAPASEAEARTRQSPSGSEGLADEVLCVKCGYSLRGLREAGQCPECGTPVAQSMHGDRLAVADPAWLARICRGQTYIAAGATLILAVFSVSFLSGLTSIGMDLLRQAGKAVDVAYPATLALALILVLIGIVKVTTLDPRLSLTRQPLGLRRLSRGAAVGALLCVPLASAVGPLLPGGARPAAEAGFAWTYPIILAFTVVMVTLYLARLAERIPDQKLAQRTKSIARRFTVCLVGLLLFLGANSGIPTTTSARWPDWMLALGKLLYAILGLASVVGFLGYTVSLVGLWFAYRKVFKRCLLESRRPAAA